MKMLRRGLCRHAGLLLFTSILCAAAAVESDARQSPFWPPAQEPEASDGFSRTGELAERWRNDTWEPTNRERWVYEDGRIAAKFFDSMWGDAWRVSRREFFDYTASPQTMTITKADHRVNIYATTQRDVHTFDDAGQPSNVQTSAIGPDSREVPVWLYAFSYDQEGSESTTTHVQKRWTGDTWLDVNRFTVRRDAQGRLLGATQERMGDAGWEADQRLEYEYEGETLGRRTVVMFREGRWITFADEVYTRNADGRVVETMHQTIKDAEGNLAPQLRQINTYDDFGNLTGTVHKRIVDGVWVDARRTTYSFDRAGQEPTLGSIDKADLATGAPQKSTTTTDNLP